MAVWTPQQLECLAILNVPVYDFKAPPSAAERMPAPSKQAPAEPEADEQEANAPEHYYRLDPWLLRTQGPLPVQGVPWLNDLAAYVGAPLSQVKQQDHAVDISAYLRDSLTATEKKQLWALLQENVIK
ncbi:MAG: hypothetical protein C0463_04845 [Idiomarina sp.]|nr:hypothetical protein [Idiomarina sp.]